MRGIKFRGRIVDSVEWVYGYVVYTDSRAYILPHRDGLDFDDIDFGFGFIQVIPETVGQYTGIHDKNGKEIFEGDIVRIGTFREEDGEESWWMDDSTHRVEWCGEHDYPAFDLRPSIDTDCNGLAYIAVGEQQAEVIGNIHENPELIK